MTRPRARKERLVVREIADETLVYDLERHKAHCLNRTTAQVWRLCDGRKPVAQIATRLAEQLGVPADDATVWLALRQLDKAHLLREDLPSAPSAARREIVRRLGIGAALLPAIASILAPTAAAAAACSAASGRPRAVRAAPAPSAASPPSAAPT